MNTPSNHAVADHPRSWTPSAPRSRISWPKVAILLVLGTLAAQSAHGDDRVDSLSWRIDSLSLVSLNVETYASGRRLGTATGFLVSYKERLYLVTNWHVVTGRRPNTGALIGSLAPDTIAVYFFVGQRQGAGTESWIVWCKERFALYSPDSTHVWLEHPKGREIDVVAIPIEVDTTKTISPIRVQLDSSIR